MTGLFYYVSEDSAHQKEYKENIGYVNLDVSESAAQRTANAQKIDTLARAINGLTNNQYSDSYVQYEYSIGAILGE